MAVLEPTKGGYYLWNYLPSLAAAVIFILLFLVMTALIFWRMIKTKTWFCVPFAIGGIFEFAGYCARASAHNKTGRIMPFAVQNVFILLGPALFAASIYMCLSRIIRSVRAENLSLIKPRKLTATFVTGDILSFVVQGGAAGLMVTGKNAKLGEGIVIAGLMIQIIMFGFFAATAVIFQSRITRSPTPEAYNPSIPWKKSLRMLFIVSALIMIRSLFRVVEYAMGNDGYLLKHEWTMYIFDSVLMFGVMVVYYLWYPTYIANKQIEPESYGV
ncbi:RTA1 like protein [Corynespora cassiicola Philippines]|uniref:RTA1 like protein n=1 Tax=Corynespora cassiicola Philippines TaxID=1448308 RepID=A0A2T2N9S9_CORCC|nr:RTA1 like protein [Corynespora cassiicola Philippines]